MNKRDFLKGTAALAAAPAILAQSGSVAAALAERQAARAANTAGPTPSYVYDSKTGSMRFYRADQTSFPTFAYLNAA